MKLRTRIAPLALTAALSLGLAACGNDPEPAATTDDEMTEMDDEMTEDEMTEMDDEMTEDDMTETDDEMTEEG